MTLPSEIAILRLTAKPSRSSTTISPFFSPVFWAESPVRIVFSSGEKIIFVCGYAFGSVSAVKRGFRRDRMSHTVAALARYQERDRRLTLYCIIPATGNHLRSIPRKRNSGNGPNTLCVSRLARPYRTSEICPCIPIMHRAIFTSPTNKLSVRRISTHGHFGPCTTFARFNDDDRFVGGSI